MEQASPPQHEMLADVPSWVIRVDFTVGRPVPVYPDERTS
jgi:hypothetical protein